MDYDKTDRTTQQFFTTVQNLLIYAVTGKTAAELVVDRANPQDAHFGLLTWKGSQVRKEDILIAKNYLTEDEVDTLNRLVVIFLETAELRTKSRQSIPMAFWMENIGQIITSNGFALLENAGVISRQRMKQHTEQLYINFETTRKQQQALEADLADETELKALEQSIKKRK